MSRFAAVLLAAGQGTRFRARGGEGPSKLVAEIGGIPLVRHVAEAACGSPADPVIVVTGHARSHVERALAGLDVRFVHNASSESGLASSLRQGVADVPADVAGAIVLLGDMPMVTRGLIGRLLAAADAVQHCDAVVPVVAGRRGNPVVLSRRLFPAVAALAGDAGARQLLRQPGLAVHEVPIEEDAVALDVDDPADLARIGRDQRGRWVGPSR